LIWIIRNQFGRRNITLAARCQLAEKLAAALKPQAKENQQAHGGTAPGRKKTLSPILAEVIDSREQAAKEAGVSHGSMAAYKLVKSEGTPAEVTLVLSDPNTKLHRVAKDIKDRKVKLQYETRVQTSAAKKHEVPSGPFDLILADPPWQYKITEADNRKIENHYDTQSLDQICANTPPNTAQSCVLLLWATAPLLLEALRVMDAWGFAYKTSAVWDKEILGMGYWFRGQHELLLVGIKGKVSPPSPGARVSSVFREARAKHSAKPECVFNWIEKAFPDAKKLERYARKARPGWACEGNEL
jgi:N6-adenosine-specific RNA methylase IME4